MSYYLLTDLLVHILLLLCYVTIYLWISAWNVFFFQLVAGLPQHLNNFLFPKVATGVWGLFVCFVRWILRNSIQDCKIHNRHKLVSHPLSIVLFLYRNPTYVLLMWYNSNHPSGHVNYFSLKIRKHQVHRLKPTKTSHGEQVNVKNNVPFYHQRWRTQNKRIHDNDRYAVFGLMSGEDAERTWLQTETNSLASEVKEHQRSQTSLMVYICLYCSDHKEALIELITSELQCHLTFIIGLYINNI